MMGLARSFALQCSGERLQHSRGCTIDRKKVARTAVNAPRRHQGTRPSSSVTPVMVITSFCRRGDASATIIVAGGGFGCRPVRFDHQELDLLAGSLKVESHTENIGF
jgi:hypothetical protein